MGNFSTRIIKNAAETKSISQNSNKIIQNIKSNFSQFVPSKKSLTTTTKLCFLILCKSCSMNFSCLFLHHFMISKKYCEKKWDQKIFHQNAACYCIVKKCAFFYNYISVFQREIKKIIHKVSNF